MCMAKQSTPRRRPVRLSAGLLLALAGTATAQTPVSPWDTPARGSGGISHSGGGLPIDNMLCGFAAAPLTGSDILLLSGIALALVILGFALYRIALEDLIRRGKRPLVLTWTIVSISLGVLLLAAFALIPNVLGLCLFGILAGIFLLYLIAMMLTGKILLGIGVAFLLAAVAVVVLLQFVLV